MGLYDLYKILDKTKSVGWIFNTNHILLFFYPPSFLLYQCTPVWVQNLLLFCPDCILLERFTLLNFMESLSCTPFLILGSGPLLMIFFLSCSKFKLLPSLFLTWIHHWLGPCLGMSFNCFHLNRWNRIQMTLYQRQVFFQCNHHHHRFQLLSPERA